MSFVVNIVSDDDANITVMSYCIVDVGGVLEELIILHVISTKLINGIKAKLIRRESTTCVQVKSPASIISVAVAGVTVGEYNTLNDDAGTLTPGIGTIAGTGIESGATVGAFVGATTGT
jgi:hypothetical protein